MSGIRCFVTALPLISAMIHGCSSGIPQNLACSTIKSDAQINRTDAATMDILLNQKSAAGGELIIEFRKDDVLGKPSHQKKCSFFLEPIEASKTEATVWTASHCLDLSIDSKYRLRFYLDSTSGYAEIPVEFDQATKANAFRQRIASKSPEQQRTLLQALRPTEINYSVSKNGTDICRNSFKTGYGWSKFHQPIPDQNQIACFMYHDLALVRFSISEGASEAQKVLIEKMIEKARTFEKSNIAHPTALLKRGEEEQIMLDFRKSWIATYRTYTELRAHTGFAKFAEERVTECTASEGQNSISCQENMTLRDDLRESGFSALAELLTSEGITSYAENYKKIIPEISRHWKFYSNATISWNGQNVRPYSQFNILTNYSWNGGRHHSYSSIPLMGFVGLDWGTVTDPYSGDVRARTGAATYHWLEDGSEMFIYSIIPKQQTQENLRKGYGQLSLKPGDSGTLILADGLPMAVLATVDGEKTSGGSSILPLPEIGEEEPEAVSSVSVLGASAEANAIVSASSAQSSQSSCVN